MIEKLREDVNHLKRTLERLSRSLAWSGISLRILQSEAIGARAYCSTALTVPSATLTALAFDVEVWDTDGIWNASAPTRFTAARGGFYDAGGGFDMLAAQNTVASRLLVYVRRNGSDYMAASDNHTIAGKGATVSVSAGMIWLSAGDYIEILAYHDQGADKLLRAATAANQLYCHGWLARRP
jgi:hypothetical protein